MRRSQGNAGSFLTVANVCERFNLSKNYVYENLKTLPHLRCGAAIRFSESELVAHFKAAAAK
jgi:excisionase family DNA binding protein